MASAKSLEEMLSSVVDEYAVSALVGSLESQLASPTIAAAAQETSVAALAATNHVHSTVDATSGGANRLSSVPSQAVPSAASNPAVGPVPGSQTAHKLINSDKVMPNSNSVSAAVPASGYVSQLVTAANSATSVITSAAASPTVFSVSSRPDMKLVYPQQGQQQFQTIAAIPGGGHVTRTVTTTATSGTSSNNNNGGVGGSGGGPGVPNGNANNPGVTMTTNSLVQVKSATAGVVATTGHGMTTVVSSSTPPQMQHKFQKQQVAVLNAAGKQQMVIKQDGHGPPPGMLTVKTEPGTQPQPQQQQQQTVVATSLAQQQQQQQHSQPMNVVMSAGQNILHGVQILNVNQMRTAPGVVGMNVGGQNCPGGQKQLAPRVVISSPVRIAAGNPGGAQMIGTRAPGGMQNTITLQPGMVRGTLLVKTENGQFQLVNVNTMNASLAPGTAGTYRLQSVPAGAHNPARTMAPQQYTVTMPVTHASHHMKIQQQQTQGSQQPPTTLVHTVLQQALPQSCATPLPQTTTSMIQQQQVGSVQSNNQSVTHLQAGQVTMAGPVNTTASSTPATPQMSPDTAKKKCKNFLSTLLRLASDQQETVASNVKNLIQGLIDGVVIPEDFTTQLQRELNSSPQPCLVPFLKKSLPYLRHSLATNELSIEGVRPPPAEMVSLPPTPTVIPQIQIAPPRPNLLQQPGTQVRFVSTAGAPITAQLVQQPAMQSSMPQARFASMAAKRQPSPRAPSATASQTKSLLMASGPRTVSMTVGPQMASSPHVMTNLQKTANQGAKPGTPVSAVAAAAAKEKRTFSSSLREDDDINDVAAMGGVNLVEESARIMAANAEFVGTQIRSCKDENFLFAGALQRRIKEMVSRYGLEEPGSDVAAIISHATQERLKSLVEKLGVIAEHRLDAVKSDPRYEVSKDVKGQLKFLEELDRLEKKRHEEQEREMLLRAAKSRSKLEDPEQLKLKQKAKEMQRAEMEELRQREANMTALLAIGPRKKFKVEPPGGGNSQQASSSGLYGQGTSNSGGSGSGASGSRPQVMRPRVKRVNLRDLIFLLEQEMETNRSVTLYKAFLK